MATSDAQPTHSFSIDGYLVELQLHDDQTLNLSVRDDALMILFGAEAYRLNRVNAKTVLAGLGRTRNDIKATVTSVRADGQEAVQITITVEVPLLPKVEEKIYVPLAKKLDSGEALRSRLGDVKRNIIKTQDKLEQFRSSSNRRVCHFEKSLQCSKEEKHSLVTFDLPKGDYLITVTGLLKGNASNYAHITFTGAEICPGQLYALPADTQTTPMAYLSRAKITADKDDYQFVLSGQYGTSYPFTMDNFLITAEPLSQNE